VILSSLDATFTQNPEKSLQRHGILALAIQYRGFVYLASAIQRKICKGVFAKNWAFLNRAQNFYSRYIVATIC
jgi:hypothetical protein